MDYMVCCLHYIFVSGANFDVFLRLDELVTLHDLTNIATNLRLKTDSHGKDLQNVIQNFGRIHPFLLMCSLTRSTNS